MRWKTKPEPRPDTYWKPWLAWYPVAIENTGEKVWLEWVWRHRDRYGGGMGDSVTVSRHRTDVHWGGANLDRKGEDWPNLLAVTNGERA